MKKVFTPLLLIFTVSFTLSLKAADYTNSIGMEFNNISAGSFYMGSCKYSQADKNINKKRKFMGLSVKGVNCPLGESVDNDAEDDEMPQHKVVISKGFQMGIYEVTLGQFKEFIKGAGEENLLSDDFIENNSHGDSAAVTHVSWHDAQKFIRWLNKKEGTKAYRLPTEAQWEYAARAGTSTPYSWGTSKLQADDYAWYAKNSEDVKREHPHVVGGKEPNPWGLYDMHGNVWEWVQDWYDKDYYAKSPAKNPKGARSGQGRVYRGGSRFDNVNGLRSANRYYYTSDIRNYFLGFRLVRKP